MFFISFRLPYAVLYAIVFSSSSPTETGIVEALTSEFSESIITDILDGKDAARWVQRSLPPFLEVY